MFNIKKTMTLVKINLKNIKIAYVVTGLVFLSFLTQTIVGYFVEGANSDLALSMADTFLLLPLLGSILISTRNFRKTINLGAKRKDVLIGNIATYAMLSLVIALLALVFHFTIDRTIETYFMASLINVFGWYVNNPLVIFLRYFSFIMLISAIGHSLSFIQYRWTGWVIDLLIIAIISVFTPIAVLRQVLVFFFDLTIFTPHAMLQVFVCLLLASLLFMLNLLSINKKTM